MACRTGRKWELVLIGSFVRCARTGTLPSTGRQGEKTNSVVPTPLTLSIGKVGRSVPKGCRINKLYYEFGMQLFGTCPALSDLTKLC